MVTEKVIDEILERADILDVVNGYVKLKKSGNSYRGISPFTKEKTPSFYVVPHMGIFKDFSSGKGGNAITFIMEHEKLTFPEAVRWLAKRYNVDLQETESEDPEADHTRDLIFQLNIEASKFFTSQLYDQENIKILEYIKGRFSDDEIIAWQIGIAPKSWDAFKDNALSKGFDTSQLLTSNLVKEKNNRVYDYFRNRVIFPIENATGNICGFGARKLPWEEENQPKYINSPDSVVYNKSKLLYGMARARKAISKEGICHLVEGYTDVMAMHTAGIINCVAPCGTALTEEQILTIKKQCNRINLLYDGDTAGFDATLRNAELILKAGMAAMVTRLPGDEDPDSYIKVIVSDLQIKKSDKTIAEVLKEQQQSFVTWRAKSLLEETGEDPLARHTALKEIVRLLSLIPDQSMKEVFMDDVVKKNKLQKKLVKEMLENNNGPVDIEYDDDLPAGVDPKDFQRWGFYSYKNEYHFRAKNGKISNFIMKPLFHIESAINSSRLYELTNYKGYKVVVNLNMKEMTSLQSFKQNIEGRGNFLWWGAEQQFSKLKLKLYEETRSATEIKNLGWQKEGFWAWSNGIIQQDGTFLHIDEYGIIEYENNTYFIPAFSQIYITDKSIFEDERRFIFRSRDEISIKTWAELFTKVYGDNGKIGIAFWIAALFRDRILKIFGNFPILNLFGPKNSGKSQMAIALSCLFGGEQKPFNIFNGTKPGLAEHLQLFVNAIALIDEYKNELETDKIEALKSIYDAIGRSRMNMDKGKKETTKVNSAAILFGQEMPTRDVALFSRVIFLRYYKIVFSDEERRDFQILKDMQNENLSHLTSQVIKHRDYFTKNFSEIYDSTYSELSSSLNSQNIESRIMNNFAVILAAFRTIENCIKFPFSYENLLGIAIEYIKIQNSQISSSNEVSVFWDILEAMFDDNILIDGWHFKIQYTDSLIGKSHSIDFGKGGAKHILKFKFNSVIKLYSEHAGRMKVKPLPADTLKYYLENHPAFIIVEKNCRFSRKEFSQAEGQVIEQKQITTAYCFDYSKLKINLSREAIMSKENHYPIGFKMVDSENQDIKLAAEADKDDLPW